MAACRNHLRRQGYRVINRSDGMSCRLAQAPARWRGLHPAHSIESDGQGGLFGEKIANIIAITRRNIPMPYATEENLTDLAMKQWAACRSPRLRQIMQSL